MKLPASVFTNGIVDKNALPFKVTDTFPTRHAVNGCHNCIGPLRCYVYPFVFGGTGDELFTLKINPEDLIKVNEIKGIFE